MGFDSDRKVLGSSFSVSSGKKRSLNPTARKGEEKFPISPFKRSERKDLRASKYENSGKDLSGLKSVEAAFKGDKNLNVNSQKVSTYSGKNRTMGVKGNGISNSIHASLPSSPCTMGVKGNGIPNPIHASLPSSPSTMGVKGNGIPNPVHASLPSSPCTMDVKGNGIPNPSHASLPSSPSTVSVKGNGIPNPTHASLPSSPSTMSVKGNGIPNPIHASPPSSPCVSRKRLPDLRSNLSNEGSPKSARTDCHSINKNNNTHGGVPAPKGQYRRILSFGNIYKASNDLALKKSPSHSKDAQMNDTPHVVKGSMGLGVSELNRSNKHVLGFGGCNYGHGNIVKGVKNVECIKSNEDIGNKNMTENLNCKFSKSSPQFESVEEFNKAGNMKYWRGCFMEALSFYNKAIALCPQNAACHNNKAAALAGLGKLTEAVGECLEAIKCDPSCSRAHYRLGTLYTRLGRVDDARWHFKLSGNNLGPEIEQRLLHIEAHLKKTDKARKVKDWNLVLTESTLCIQAGADASNKLVAVKAEALLKIHRGKEALDLVMAARNSEESRSRKASKGISYLLIIETQVNLYLGRFEEGVLAMEQAVTLDSNRKSLMWLRKARGAADARKAGNEFYKAGKYLEACTMYGHGLQYVPANSVLLCNRAACRSKLGQWEIAIDDCNASLKNRPDYFKALLWRAHCYARLERWGESLQDYSVLSKELPGDRGIANSLLQVQMELKKAQGAEICNL